MAKVPPGIQRMPGAGAGPGDALVEGAADMRARPTLEKRFAERHHPMRVTRGTILPARVVHPARVMPAPVPRRCTQVQLDIDEAAEDLDHLITPEERLRVAMARQ
jgi:hypothetical protein